MIHDDGPPFSNVLFSYLFVGNILLFLLWLPAVVYQFNPNKIGLLLIVLLLICYSIFSYGAFYRGIDIPDQEGRMARFHRLSSGDKEFFSYFSKPIAILVQIILFVLQLFFLASLYEFVNP